MAKLPPIKRILRENIKEAPAWIDRIIVPLNLFLESTYFALNKNITFRENINSEIREIEFTTKSDYTTASPKEDGFDYLSFAHSLKSKPEGLTILQITEKSSSSYQIITSPVSLDWTEINGQIRINYITGLKDSTTYNLKVLAI